MISSSWRSAAGSLSCAKADWMRRPKVITPAASARNRMCFVHFVTPESGGGAEFLPLRQLWQSQFFKKRIMFAFGILNGFFKVYQIRTDCL